MSMMMIIPTSLSQLRNAYISSILNKSDVATSVIFLDCMLSLLPPSDKDTKDPKPDPPKEIKSFYDDPDDEENHRALWNYFAKLAPYVEKQFAKFVTNLSGSKDFR